MNIFSKSLRSQFIVYALSSAFLPLLIIGIVFFIYMRDFFRLEQEMLVKKSYMIVNRQISSVERDMSDKSRLFSSLLSFSGNINKSWLGGILERSRFHVFEFCFANKPFIRNISAGLSESYQVDEIYTEKELLNKLWIKVSSMLFSSKDVIISKFARENLLLMKFASVVTDLNMKKIGMTVLTRIIDDTFCSTVKRQNGAELIIYRNGHPLVSSLFSSKSKNDLKDYKSIENKLQKKNLIIEERVILKTKYTVGYFPIYNKKEIIAIAAVAHNMVQLKSSVNTVVIFLFFFFVISLGVIIVLGFYFAKKVLQPVYSLVEATEKMAKGELDVRIPERPENELGRLVDSFNVMAVSVYSQRQFLDNYNENLKEEVETRKDELEVAQKAIIHSAKMASLGQLTAGIAHEIKNPLNFILNFSGNNIRFMEKIKSAMETVRDSIPTDNLKKIDKFYNFIQSNSEDILEESQKIVVIIQGMLNQARSDSNHMDLYDINSLINESTNLLYHSMRASRPNLNVTIDKDLDITLGSVFINSSQISRVFVNIMDNAIFAVADKQKTAEKDYRPLVKIKTYKENEYVIIEIEDNGSGMPDEVKEKIFEPFFTTKPPQEGTGLGLKISYDIITDGHNGTIKVESEAGFYTKFTISLPIKEQI